MITNSSNLAVTLIAVCFLVCVSGATSPEKLPDDPFSAEIGFRPLAGLPLKSAKTRSASATILESAAQVHSDLPTAASGSDETWYLNPNDPTEQPTVSAAISSKEKKLDESTMTYQTSILLFFLASMIVLPWTNIAVRFLKATIPKLSVGLAFHTFWFVAICALIYGCYDFESKGEPGGTTLTTNILQSRCGWTWSSFVVASFLAGLAACSSHRYYKFLSFLSGFTGDFAFVLSCYIESTYHLTSLKDESGKTYALIPPLEDRALFIIVVLYLLISQILEFLAQRFDLIHRGHEKIYDEDFDEDDEYESEFPLKFSVASQTLTSLPEASTCCQTLNSCESGTSGTQVSNPVPGFGIPVAAPVYNRNKYRIPWTGAVSTNSTVASEAPVLDAKEEYVAIEMDLLKEHEGQGDKEK